MPYVKGLAYDWHRGQSLTMGIRDLCCASTILGLRSKQICSSCPPPHPNQLQEIWEEGGLDPGEGRGWRQRCMPVNGYMEVHAVCCQLPSRVHHWNQSQCWRPTGSKGKPMVGVSGVWGKNGGASGQGGAVGERQNRTGGVDSCRS